jgi:TonB family protein
MTLLLDSALKATVILTAAWLATIFLRRRSADMRHRVWLAAMLAVAGLPALILAIPQALPQAQIIVTAQGGSVPMNAARIARAFPWMLTLWASIAALIVARSIAGIVRMAQITRRAVLHDSVFYSDEISTPLTWGFFRPAILLPACASEWGEAQREIVIAHERAHIDRHDCLWQTFARLVTAVFWFHPLVWLASVALRREAELAVDDRVLNSGADPSDYASHLVSVARGLIGTAPAESVAMVRTSALDGRVRAILDAARPRLQAGWVAKAAIIVAVGALLFPLAAFQDQQVHKVGEKGLKPPRVVSKVEPEYSEEARDAKLQGTVVVQCVIDENGAPQRIVITRSLGSGLDEKALQAVTQWHFAPGEKDGQPVAVMASIEINFRLQ